MREIEQAQRDNLAHFMERGPALSYAYTTYILARDVDGGRVLLGGLGSMGMGRMWVDERPEHRDYPGYSEAATFSPGSHGAPVEADAGTG